MSVREQAVDEELGARATSGVLWLAAQKWVIRLTGFGTLVVLTRQVSPQEFGVVAAAMTVIPIIYLLSDLGFSTYLLQSDELDRTSLSTAFWTSVAAGAALSAGLLAVAPLLADAFDSPALTAVLRALVLAVVPTVLGSVPLALLKRAMAFRTVAMQALVASVLAQVVAVVTALLGAGVWALVCQLVVSQWVIAVLAWRSARWIPSMSLSPRLFRRMTVFGMGVSSVELVAMVKVWAESWIITVVLGTPALGQFNIAQRLVQVAQELSAAPIVPVSTVVFARIRGSAERLGAAYLRALGISYAVVAPMMIAIVVGAPLIVPLLFGDAWSPSVAPTQGLAVAGIITLGAMLDHGLFYGLGRPGSWLRYSVVVDSLTVAVTAVAVHWGMAAVAVGFVGVAVVATVVRWVLVGRMIGLAPTAVARPFVVVMAPAVVAMAAGEALLRALSGTSWPIATLAVVLGVTVAVDLALLRLTAGHILRDALEMLPLPGRFSRPVARLLRLGAVHRATGTPVEAVDGRSTPA